MNIQTAQNKVEVACIKTQEVINLLNGSHIQREQRAIDILTKLQADLKVIADALK